MATIFCFVILYDMPERCGVRLHTYIHTYIFYLLEQVIKASSNIADVDLPVKPGENKIDRPE